jgi:hypothetical protein
MLVTLVVCTVEPMMFLERGLSCYKLNGKSNIDEERSVVVDLKIVAITTSIVFTCMQLNC